MSTSPPTSRAAPRRAVAAPLSSPRRPTTRAPGLLLLPLRAFLGGTFTYAGLQKLADRNFFDAQASNSIYAQLRGAARTSPVAGLARLALHAPVEIGLLIAFAEIAIGVAALLGLWTKAAAAGGIVLATGFLLTVSWHSRPYYLGPDIVYLFAWTPLLLAGAGDLWSMDRYLADRARSERGIAAGGDVIVEFDAIRRLCGAYDRGRCQAMQGRACAPTPCPALRPPRRTPMMDGIDRRTFLLQSGVAARAAAAALGAGGILAIAGRMLAGPRRATDTKLAAPAAAAPPPTAAPTTAAPPAPSATTRTAPAPRATTPPTTAATHPPGTAIGPASAVPVGRSARFTDPATGNPAVVLQPQAGHFVAFSAVCTHQGCTVDFDSSQRAFICPCHGAAFSADSGAVLQGPARRPLSSIPVQAGSDGELYAQ